jgi:hypothetical protein
MGRGVASGILAAVAILAVLTSCARPAGTIALSLYHRNLSQQPFSYRVLGTPPESEEWAGLVPDVISSAGCGFVLANWEIVVVEGERRPEPADELVARAAADDFGSRDPVAIALSIEPDGTVEISEGVPAWWNSDIQRCP